MDTNFYANLFPSVGLRVLAVFKNGLKSPPTHSFYDNNDDLLAAAATYDGLGKNVYHGCAVYKTSDNRKGDNVLAMQAIWLDLDVGPGKPYASQKDAATHYEQFRTALGLPTSHVVSSGSGVHQYHSFTKPILPEQWDRLAALYAACLDHFGVMHDTSRTQDKASILRIPGTHNYKTSPAKSVTLKRLGQSSPAKDLWAQLKAYADTHELIVGSKPTKAAPVTNDLIGTKDYPPAEGPLVASNCPILSEVESTGGHVDYDIWWRAMGVAKHCEDGETVAQHWTRERAATGHDKHDWQTVLNTWAMGPTTCAEFSKHSGKCASCPHSGKITSPIQLGVSAQPIVAALPPPQAAAAIPTLPGQWTFGAQWIMDAVARKTRTGYSNGEMTMSERQEDGTFKHKPFCSRYWQVMDRIRTVEGVWQLVIGYEQYPGKPYKTFCIDSSAVTASDLLRKEFSSRELHIFGGARAIVKAQEVMMYEQTLLYNYQQETATFPTMGWVSVDHKMRGELTGEFVLGDTVFRPKEPPQQVLLADTVDVTLRADFSTKGTTDQWVALIDRIYNRPKAEAYQFIIAAMFASPLVRLMPGGGEWHGIPIVLWGESGAAKTSTALAALSMYAPGQVLRFSAQGGKGGQGDTINALSIKMGSLRNLPFLMDEMSDVDPEKFGSIFYMQANGKAKDRMSTNGKMIPNPYRWDLLSLVTANESSHEVLKGLRNQQTQEATQLRSFEIWLKNDVRTLFKDIHRSTVEDDLLAQQYGKVGREWIQFVVNNRIRIQEELGKKRKAYMINPEDTSSIRFYKDLLVTISVAATLAKAKGFIRWDVGAMMIWAESQLITLRDSVGQQDWESTISDFVASLHGRTIVTRHMKLGPGRRAKNVELPLEPLSVNAIPVARKALEDKRFVVTSNALREWASKHRMTPSTLLAEMMQRGYLVGGVPGQKLAPALINIGSGTSITRPQAQCFELNYDKVVHFSASDEAVDMTNVVQLQTGSEVTEPSEVTAEVTVATAGPSETSVSP